ncbi:MAG: 5-(carboxyamino)imidazole ribonucleotide mutase [Actinomycetota bacterium]
MSEALVAIVMGSDSDWPIMEEAAKVLDGYGISYSAQVISAHRMPRETIEFAQSAKAQGLKVIIAGAGGAAALPGVIAALTPLPVIGVPIALKSFDGLDSLLSIVQMPAGIPVATVGVGGAKNAGILAARILGAGDSAISTQVEKEMEKIHDEAVLKGENLQARRSQKTGF